MKHWRKDKARIRRDIPSLIALMLHYLSDESLEAMTTRLGYVTLLFLFANAACFLEFMNIIMHK